MTICNGQCRKRDCLKCNSITSTRVNMIQATNLSL
uniref:Uncharacterized protein n=1 Tax=Rhizophora mucronata TaxID=61149 RepID=A0A2P2PXW5_RHIMU